MDLKIFLVDDDSGSRELAEEWPEFDDLEERVENVVTYSDLGEALEDYAKCEAGSIGAFLTEYLGSGLKSGEYTVEDLPEDTYVGVISGAGYLENESGLGDIDIFKKPVDPREIVDAVESYWRESIISPVSEEAPGP